MTQVTIFLRKSQLSITGIISKIDYKSKRVLVNCEGHCRWVWMKDVFIQPTFIPLDLKLRSDLNRSEMFTEIPNIKAL
jgi:hypothetical protein